MEIQEVILAPENPQFPAHASIIFASGSRSLRESVCRLFQKKRPVESAVDNYLIEQLSTKHGLVATVIETHNGKLARIDVRPCEKITLKSVLQENIDHFLNELQSVLTTREKSQQ